MRILFGTAMAIALFSGCAATPAPATSAAGTQVASADQKICRSQTNVGSALPKRVCATQAQWDEYDDMGAKSADAFKDATRTNSAPTKDGAWTMPGTPN